MVVRTWVTDQALASDALPVIMSICGARFDDTQTGIISVFEFY
jgi:hypothetical protein